MITVELLTGAVLNDRDADEEVTKPVGYNEKEVVEEEDAVGAGPTIIEVKVAFAVVEHAVGVTRDPSLSYGEYPRQEAYSPAHVALFASAWPRQVL